MNENGKNKREWVKTAAIIFLAVMLVLTFFSNTIRNYSLPEVSTQYVQSGTITAKIRGTGVVESGDPYEVSLSQTRKISSVNVRVGDKVQKGDILVYLEDMESAELNMAREQLKAAKDAYDNAILQAGITASDISSAQGSASSAAYRSQLTAAQEALKAAEEKLKPKQVAVDQLNQAITDCNAQIQYENSMNSQAGSQLTVATNALAAATTKKNAAETTLSEAQAAVSAKQAAITAKQSELNTKQTELSNAQSTLAEKQGTLAAKQGDLASAQAALSAADPADTAAVAAAQAQVDAATAAVASAQTDVNNAQATLDALSGHPAAIDALNTQITGLNSELATLQTAETNAQNAYNTALAAYNTAVANKAAAEQNSTNRDTSTVIANVEAALAKYQLQLYSAQKELAAAEAEVADCQKVLTDLISKIGNVSELEALLDNIKKAQAQVDELAKNSVGATVAAEISGTVTQINIVAGNEAMAGNPFMLLQPEGKGLSMSFSVPNDQAKRVSVGDRADLVNAWRYDDVNVTLSSIKPDRQEPGQKKLLTFEVTGNVMAGQTLNISVGQKSANFDLIVPNSAIREDANGKFILTVESKSSPLGNRYVATRTDVQVIASDEKQSAITGALYGWEYVIVNSTKPVEAGQLIRLAEN